MNGAVVQWLGQSIVNAPMGVRFPSVPPTNIVIYSRYASVELG